MNIVDPSGNIPVPHPVPGCTRYDADGYCVQGGTGYGWDPVEVLHEGDTITTESGGSEYTYTLKYGGDEFLNLYYHMLSLTGAWWFGGDGIFTFEEFCGLLLMHEGAGLSPYMELDAIAASQQLYIGAYYDPYCPNGYSVNGAANYWAVFSQSAHGLVDKYIRGTGDISNYEGYGGDWGIDNPLETMERAAELGNMMLHLAALNPDRNGAMSDYGNNGAVVEKLSKTDIKSDTYYPSGNQGIYYYTADGDGIWYSVNGTKWFSDP